MDEEIEVKFLLKDFDRKIVATKDNLSILHVRSIDELFKDVIFQGSYIEQYYIAFEKVPEILKIYDSSIDSKMYTIGRIRKERFRSKTDYILCFKTNGDYIMGEKEFEISSNKFEEYKNICTSKLNKYRLKNIIGEYKAEIDVFQNNSNCLLNNLILAEIEIKNVEEISKVPKLGLDVSELKQYKNFNLSLMNK